MRPYFQTIHFETFRTLIVSSAVKLKYVSKKRRERYPGDQCSLNSFRYITKEMRDMSCEKISPWLSQLALPRE